MATSTYGSSGFAEQRYHSVQLRLVGQHDVRRLRARHDTSRFCGGNHSAASAFISASVIAGRKRR